MIKIIFTVITILMALGGIGEKDKMKGTVYIYATIMMAIVTLLAYKFL